jgi:hypothetical protein
MGGSYSLTTNYFDNFGPNNATDSKESILAWPNAGTAVNNGINSGDIRARWMMTLHYNSWDKKNSFGSAGWNGFSTVADFYNMFGSGDKRVGGESYSGRLETETQTAVEILDPTGKKHVLQRKDIETMRGSELSIMPNGFETLSPADLKALLAYLTQSTH